MWVVKLPMVVYFAGELGGNRLRDLFDRNASACETVSTEPNFPE